MLAKMCRSILSYTRKMPASETLNAKSPFCFLKLENKSEEGLLTTSRPGRHLPRYARLGHLSDERCGFKVGGPELFSVLFLRVPCFSTFPAVYPETLFSLKKS